MGDEGLKVPMSSSKKVMLPVALLGLALAVFFGVSKFNSSQPASETASVEPTSAPATASKQSPLGDAKNASASGMANKAETQINLGSKVTYRPGITRPFRKMEGDLYSNAYDNKIRWWLYANTEEDAQWLDRYGFPTPEEEERLVAASDAELSELVALGDQNAKAHLVVRAAKLAVMSGVDLDVRKSSFNLNLLVDIGGPYQAFMVMQGVQEMLYAYDRLPKSQQTEAQRRAIEDFSYAQMSADALGTAYGDKNFFIARNTWRPRGGYTQEFQPKKELSATEATQRIAFIARTRYEGGLPPLTIVPRPNASYQTPTFFERY